MNWRVHVWLRDRSQIAEELRQNLDFLDAADRASHA
jgi:hypothetical protein